MQVALRVGFLLLTVLSFTLNLIGLDRLGRVSAAPGGIGSRRGWRDR